MATTEFNANLTLTPPLSIEGVSHTRRTTPGNVGVCLSGGGSRACSAGMGQLRALKHLTVNGQSLLSQVRAVSTVSGGSWLGVTFGFLTGITTDDAYLNEYVSDPGNLVASNGTRVAVTLDRLPEGNIGEVAASPMFSLPALAVEAFLLWRFKKTPPEMLWQTLMGMHILQPYGLHEPGKHALPTSFFAADTMAKAAILAENPTLKNRPCHLIASNEARAVRPYLICNTAMFVDIPGTKNGTMLAPVQATPWFTGIVSEPNGTDANGRRVGGGGVTSFAFNSTLTSVDGPNVQLTQSRPWSLTDIVGASSVAYAADLQEILSDPKVLLDHLEELFDDVIEWFDQRLKMDLPSEILGLLPGPVKREILKRLVDDLGSFDPGVIIPAYDYWPVVHAAAEAAPEATRFADGGNLENTGVCAMLAYSDIDAIIAFVNSPTPMIAGVKGVIGDDGKEAQGTAVIIDGQIPPLFGYQPYDESRGYVRFPSDSVDLQSRSTVFEPREFPTLIRGLWQASGNDANPGSNARPAIFTQSLTTLGNDWFAVAEGKAVQVVWVYLHAVQAWVDMLQPEVQSLVNDTDHFPNYKTLDTHLAPTAVNLLASLTAWCVGNPLNANTFTSLFEASDSDHSNASNDDSLQDARLVVASVESVS